MKFLASIVLVAATALSSAANDPIRHNPLEARVKALEDRVKALEGVAGLNPFASATTAPAASPVLTTAEGRRIQAVGDGTFRYLDDEPQTPAVTPWQPVYNFAPREMYRPPVRGAVRGTPVRCVNGVCK